MRTSVMMRAHKPRRIEPEFGKGIPPQDKGRILFVDDIQRIYGMRTDSTPRKTAWWIRHNFAPEFKHKAGRDVYWFESEAYAWIDRQRVNR